MVDWNWCFLRAWFNFKMMPRLSYFSGNWCSQTYPLSFCRGMQDYARVVLHSSTAFALTLWAFALTLWVCDRPECRTARPWPHPPWHDDLWIWSSRAKTSWLELLPSRAVFSARLDNESSWASLLSERASSLYEWDRASRASLICSPACTLLIFQTTN
jgi:hypothetical protein